jgi:uncharacterized protein YcbX
MTARLGSLASLHRYPMKSMMGDVLKYTSPPAAGSAVPAVRVMLPDGDCTASSSPDFAQHNEVRVGIYVSVVQTGTIRIGDKLAVV